MLRKSAAALVLFCLVAPAYAGFTAEKVTHDIYFVSYERGRWTAGTLLDTAKKARRKLERASDRLCVEQGFSFMRILTPAEVAWDEDLRVAWELWAGDEPADSFQTSGGDDGLPSKTHKSRRVLLFSHEPEEGFRACVGD